MKYLYAYIHLNPIKLIEPTWKEDGIKNINKAKHYLQQYKFSSYADYLGVKREEELILSKVDFPGYFEETHEFDDYVHDWLAYKEEAE